MRKFSTGGFSDAQEEWLTRGGQSPDRTDPYILARMRSAVPDEAKPTSRDFDTTDSATPSMDLSAAPVTKTVTRTSVTKPKSDWDDNSKMLPGHEKSKIDKNWDDNSKMLPSHEKPKANLVDKSNINYIPENLRAPDYKPTSVVKNVSKEVTKVSPRSPSKMLQEESEYTIKPPLQEKGERLMKATGVRTSFKSGGKVKSASSRADGCAIRGKTRA